MINEETQPLPISKKIKFRKIKKMPKLPLKSEEPGYVALTPQLNSIPEKKVPKLQVYSKLQ
jgi:hypothetical protein